MGYGEAPSHCSVPHLDTLRELVGRYWERISDFIGVRPGKDVPIMAEKKRDQSQQDNKELEERQLKLELWKKELDDFEEELKLREEALSAREKALQAQIAEISMSFIELREFLRKPLWKNDIVEMTVEEMDLSVKAFNMVKRAGFNTVWEVLIVAKEGGLRKVAGLSAGCVKEVIQKLHEITGRDYGKENGIK